jgi:hypothetical protein
MAATKSPKRVLSPDQERLMLERERIVLQERIKGKSFYKIEQEHGIPNADRVFRRAIQRPENGTFRRSEAVRLEEARLDDLQDGIWGRALTGDPRAVEVALKILERRARMLGLDFADMISGRLAEVEEAKIRVMAGALVRALHMLPGSPEEKEAATASFFAELRSGVAQVEDLEPDDYEVTLDDVL